MVSISIAICGHKYRQRNVNELSELVSSEVVALDSGQVGCELNHIIAWEELLWFNADWYVVLEDDVFPALGFRNQLKQALVHAPSPIVSLYLGRSRPPHYQNSIAQVVGSDACFILSQELLSCVGVCIQRDYVIDMLNFARPRWRGEQRAVDNFELDLRDRSPIDEMISDWAVSIQQQISYTNPSLVQHLDMPTLLSVHPSKHREEDMSSRSHSRVAWRFGTRKDWSSSTIFMPAPGDIVTTQVNTWPSPMT